MRYRSENSVDWLTKKISTYFSSRKEGRKLTEIFFVDRQDKAEIASSVKDIVFFGDFIRKLSVLEKRLENLSDVQLWSLCKSSSIILEKKLRREVDWIDRYSLIKQRCLARSSPTTYVYAGRCSPEKNLISLIYFLFHFQKIKDPKIQIELYLLESVEFPKFKQEFIEIVESLDWSILPIVSWNLPESEWIKKVKPETCFVSLSTFFCEDFGVAIAQAEEKTQNFILSPWGGHLSVKESCFFPSRLLPFWGETIQVQKRKGELMAQICSFSYEPDKRYELNTVLDLELSKINPGLFWIEYVQVFLLKKINSIRFVIGENWEDDCEVDLILDRVLFVFLKDFLIRNEVEVKFDD